MRSFSALNLYEVLELRPGARPEEIERAYRLASSTWADGSLALYSLFDDSEAAVVRERIRHAYRVLSNREARRAYDEEHFDALATSAGEGDSDVRDDLGAVPGDASPDPIEEPLDVALDDSLAGDPEAAVEFDGARLRRARMHRGIELEDIAEITKVSCTYLRCLEEEDFARLPATVYVRGFVTAYARAIGLEPARVVASYMPRVEEGRRVKERGRLLGRS